MPRFVSGLVRVLVFVILAALLALTFTVLYRNSFDMGDVAEDLPLLAGVWAAFAVLYFAGLRLLSRTGGERPQHS